MKKSIIKIIKEMVKESKELKKSINLLDEIRLNFWAGRKR